MKYAFISALLLPLVTVSPALAADADWKTVDGILGRSATVTGNIHRYPLPRTDLKVVLDGVPLKAGFALGGWVAFDDMANDATMMMGDLVLTENEINPVLTKLTEANLEVTAIHNHLLRAQPPTFYMHVEGTGSPAKLAQAVRSALEASKTPFEPTKPTETPTLSIDGSKIDDVLGFKGKNNNGVYQVSIPRSDVISADGMPIEPAMGTGIAINFQPTGEGKAAITGDFVAVADEVNPLAKALRDNGIEVTAIHNHMLDDQPRAFFMHFWANDDALKLAKGLRAGLDAVHVAKRS